MNGDLFPVKEGFSAYMRRWYEGIFPSTAALEAYITRGIQRSIVWAPGRMIDAATDMLSSYQKNDNSPTAGAGALFPIVILAMAKDYTPTGGDWGGRQVGRRLVRLSDEEGSSIYGYRQAMGDVRAQVVIIAAEEASARSLAAQFCLFVGEIPNRRFTAPYKWGQYTLDMPVMLETPDTIFQSIPDDQKNITILAADLTLKATIPYLDAPKPNELNDGTDNNPPGYPHVIEVEAIDKVVPWGVNVMEGSVIQFDPRTTTDPRSTP